MKNRAGRDPAAQRSEYYRQEIARLETQLAAAIAEQASAEKTVIKMEKSGDSVAQREAKDALFSAQGQVAATKRDLEHARDMASPE